MYLSFLFGLLVKVLILFSCLAASRVYCQVFDARGKAACRAGRYDSAEQLLVRVSAVGLSPFLWHWCCLPSTPQPPSAREGCTTGPCVWTELWDSPWSSSAVLGHKLLLSRDARSLVWRPPGPQQPGLFPSGLHCGARGGKAQNRVLRRGAVRHGNTTGPLLTKVLTKPPSSSNCLSVGSLTFQLDWEVVFRQEQSGRPPASSRCPLVLSPHAVPSCHPGAGTYVLYVYSG